MASKKQPGPGGAVPAQEQKNGGDAARLVRKTMATFPQQAAARRRRALVDVGNLMNGRPSLVNRQKQAVAATENGRKAVDVGSKKPLVPQAAARSRRPLADIKNLIINDRAAPANRQKPLAAVNRNGKAVMLKECKVKPEVIVISPDTEKEKKAKTSGGPRFCRRVPTLFDHLTKCSRDSDGVVSSPKKTDPYDIDTPDSCNELAVVEYVEDIYRFYKSTEGTCLPLSSYMSSQAEISERMRAILIDWIIEELQLVGISAMLIASKYEETWAPLVKDLLCLCDNAFTRDQILTKEKAILDRLHWNLTVPTMYMFIVRYLKAAMGDEKLENMAFFYSELALVQYTMLVYPPSVTAAAAVYAARCTLGMNPRWTDILEHHTGLTEPQLLDCGRRLIRFHALAPESKQKAVYKKYSSPKLGAVALQSPDKKLLPV
ncbi:cyclin-B1-3-like isoform X2 [Miscanthus floridulus]|uniref:cyclin-B1-3-like isoform X2 n=1 Tax=Miscanthus floridulus TaxID=154761 RepID=UPI003457E776